MEDDIPPPLDIYQGVVCQVGLFYSRQTEDLYISKIELDKLPIFVKVSSTQDWFLIGKSKNNQELVCKNLTDFRPSFTSLGTTIDTTEAHYLHAPFDTADAEAKIIKEQELEMETEDAYETNFHCDVANEEYLKVIANLKYLLASNYRVNFSLRDFEEKTPLIIAAKVSGACDLVIDYMLNEMLANNQDIAKELDVDAQDDQGRTALHYLCAYGLLKHVKRLVQLGANINVPDEHGITPVDFSHADKNQLQFLLGSIAIDGDRASNFYTELGGRPMRIYHDERAARTKVVGIKESCISIVDVIISRKKQANFIQELSNLGAISGAGPQMLRGSYATYGEDTKFLMDRDPTFCLHYERCVSATMAKNYAAKKIQRAYRKYKSGL